MMLCELLRRRSDLHLLAAGTDGRAAESRETELLNTADVVVLCLPSATAVRAVGRITNRDVRVLDLSSEHVLADGWTYGLPELNQEQREAIRSARRVSGTGCFAVGFVLALRPLVEWGVVDPAAPISVQGVGGYSAGGRRMIDRYESPRDGAPPSSVEVYGLDLRHPQVAEMRHHTGLRRAPLFAPWVGNFRRGTLVCVPLHRDWLRAGESPASLREALRDRYAGERMVSVRTRSGLTNSVALPSGVGWGVDLYVEGNDDHVLLFARLDNLAKGSAGAAVQNVNLMLGCEEYAGIDTGGA